MTHTQFKIDYTYMHTLHAFAHVLSSVSNMYEHEFQAKCMSRQQCVRDEECALPEFYLGGGGGIRLPLA